MNRLLMLSSAAAAAIAFTPAVMAQDNYDDVLEESVLDLELALPVEAEEEIPVRLVSWSGDFEFMKTSRRLRIWRSHIAYNLTVDPDGAATNCELTEPFRLRRVSDRLCEVLMEHHTFEPALDATGTAIEGSYSSRISYRDVQERL